MSIVVKTNGRIIIATEERLDILCEELDAAGIPYERFVGGVCYDAPQILVDDKKKEDELH